jgi:hypothetical protein
VVREGHCITFKKEQEVREKKKKGKSDIRHREQAGILERRVQNEIATTEKKKKRKRRVWK